MKSLRDKFWHDGWMDTIDMVSPVINRKWNPPPSFARELEYDRRHLDRLRRRINGMSRKLLCQECSGAGSYVEVVLDDGTGPTYTCTWCSGIGYVVPHTRGLWLRYRKETK